MLFMERVNQEYFDGELSPAVMAHMETINEERPEVQSWVERMARQMRAQHFGGKDFNEVLAWVIGTLLSKILPGAWGGSVPPVTVEGRHAGVDDYMEQNPWRPLVLGDRFLDLGCGFPPVTTMNSAKRFPGVQVIGADPSFARYLVQDPNGDYACFDPNAELIYFQTGSNEVDRWDALFSDPDATRDRFRAYLLEARGKLPGNDSTFGSAEASGFKVLENPVLEFVTDNLEFEQQGIGSEGLTGYGMVRCFNVLCYFDGAFRKETLEWLGGVLEEGGLFLTGMNWTRSRNARYAVYQAQNGALVPKEFAFGVENIRPLEIVTWFALHDDDFETRALAELIGSIRANEGFRRDFDKTMDEILADTGFTSRQDDGYLGAADDAADPSTFDAISETVGEGLEAAGFAQRAASVLTEAGYAAWVNCVGHIAVDPAGLKEV